MNEYKIFIGLDPRQPVAHMTAYSSLIRHASKPLAVTPLILNQLPITRRGLTEFTFTRFLAPYLSGYKGKSLFIDSDMMFRADVVELFESVGDEAVSVVPFSGRLQFERPSVMVFNNEKCTKLTPEYIDDPNGNPFDFSWADSIGSLAYDWNHLVGYSDPDPEAKLVHFTQGIPVFEEVAGCEYEEEYQNEIKLMRMTVPWKAIMGGSVHREEVEKRNLGKRIIV